MTDLAVRLLIFGALWTVVVWCLFGVVSYLEQERMWRKMRRG